MDEQAIWSGDVVALYIAPTSDTPMQAVEEIHLHQGRGIEGDRYYLQAGKFGDDEEEPYQVTLIESEAIESVIYEGKGKVIVDIPALRRNIVTRGFSLVHLVGNEFQVGSARLRGVALYEPGVQMMEALGHKIAIALMHRGGLIAEVIANGSARVGDSIHA